ncbi:hypothetical protein OJF2_44570 [Aquisphaera giovannonii]|uniref:Glycoside hydrolase 123 C-terminal domain-containing protein n=1 Tax=Aquisphaera giovannonii TaxID=406548 RepID=A0A5B9W7J6_9BACT|nr:hypothetical protein [Aquisphaera giovannonii]QEH35900.1 hypothetical protein OJF2_44570 [Aquisphaera giovannonii]
MRKGWREVLFVLAACLMGPLARAAPGEGKRAGAEDRVGIAVELRWSPPAAADAPGPAEAEEISLSTSDGQVADVVAWPAEKHAEGPRPHRGPDEDWRLGSQPSGRVRARLEVTPAADLVVRKGGSTVRIPVATILEKPQQGPPQAAVAVTVERLAWDSLMIDLGQGAESGVVAPSTAVPLSLRHNIVWPDAAEVIVRTTAILRPMGGTEALWRDERRETMPANRLEPPTSLWTVPAPRQEGSYVVEFHSAWEPAGPREGSRLGRLIRRRKPTPVASSATRRAVLAVVAPAEPPAEASARETEVDAVDPARVRNTRFSASGRSPASRSSRTVWAVPAEVLAEAARKESDRERLRAWIGRSEAASLPPADESGLGWSAVGLRVPHPDRLHRVTVTVAGGDPSALGVALVDPGGPGRRPRVLLDACASGPPILKDGPAVTFSWLVWPDSPDPLLVFLNRNPGGPVRLGPVKVAELSGVPAGPAIRAPGPDASRSMGLYLTGDRALDRFGGHGEVGLVDNLEVARNLAAYLGYCGASLAVLPEPPADRAARRGLRGQADEDATGPDQAGVVLRLLARQGCAAWLELSLDGRDALPGLPPPDSPEALRLGLVRVDRQGLADGPCYHPLHPDVRRAMRRRVEGALARRDDGGRVAGVLLQLGPGPTLLGSPDTGMDDDTFTRFVREAFGPETAASIPGTDAVDPGRFAARSKYLQGVGRMPWMAWRSKAIAGLYAELAEAARAASPETSLALATPSLHDGAAGVEARRADLAGLAPSQAWRSVGLDLQAWQAGASSPILLRGVELSTDALAHDLAVSPDLDARLSAYPNRGLLLKIDPDAAGPAADPEDDRGGPAAGDAAGAAAADSGAPGAVTLAALPLGDGVAADEPLGHALAALDARWVVLAAPAIAGHEDRLRRFASVLRGLPARPARQAISGGGTKDHGVSVRTIEDAGHTFLQVANDTPYPIRLAGVIDAPAEAPVEDLGRNLKLMPQPAGGGRQLVLDLLPFGVAAIRVGAPGVQMAEITPYPSEAVLASMEAQYRELSAQLSRLNRGPAAAIGEPLNPGFEPVPAEPLRRVGNVEGAAPAADGAAVPGGWKAEGAAGAEVAIDGERPHAGQGCLKLTAPAASASATSGDFPTGGSPSLTIQAFLRAEPAGSAVRLWIQGEVGGQPYLRRTEFRVGPDWEAKAVRAADLPAGGLDSARLRFEMLGPGTLWIDDLRLAGEAPSRAVRLNAQRTLIAALQAYRAQHYAEFARLSRSHWARHPGVLAAGRPGRPGEISEAARGRRPGQGPAEASALSPEKTLR